LIKVLEQNEHICSNHHIMKYPLLFVSFFIGFPAKELYVSGFSTLPRISASTTVPIARETILPYRNSHSKSEIHANPGLRLSNNDDGNEIRSKGTVRFSDSSNSASIAKQDGGSESTLDSILFWIISDIGSIVLGCVGLFLLVVGRISFGSLSENDVDALGEETRFNLLAALACCSVLVNGLSKLDVTTALAETVQLFGTNVIEPATFVSKEEGTTSLSWLIKAVLAATPAETAVVLCQQQQQDRVSWNIEGYGGILPQKLLSFASQQSNPFAPEETSTTPILDRFIGGKMQGESYLPTLQALPGRTEFLFYLPSNTQAVLLVPFGKGHVLVLGANQAKSFTPRDIAWCQAAAQRTGEK